jgi:hypothetical protein
LRFAGPVLKLFIRINLKDDAERAILRDVVPGPVYKDNELVPDAQYKHQVKEHPEVPCEVTVETDQRQNRN